MEIASTNIKITARKNATDHKLRSIIRKATLHSLSKRDEVVSELPQWEELRREAQYIRKTTIEKLDLYLEELERNLISNGVEVLWAKDETEARDLILKLLKQVNASRIVKSKSMVTEEIELNRYLEEKGYEIVETDLGEYIVQLAGEKPSHITAPALHKSKEQIGELFHNKLGLPYTADPSVLTNYARSILRDKFLKADVGISGANFLIAESGTIVIIENEGNACLTTALPGLHIVVTGIEKVIPAVKDLGVLLKLLPRSATGQRITSYVSLISSKRKPGSPDAPERVVVLLIDNGRSKILGDSIMNESLSCIRCGACMNICPVYQTIGGHAYGSTYPGPIGSVITPLLTDSVQSWYLPYASSLCGACSEICPVKIDIHRLLLLLRHRSVSRTLYPAGERLLFLLWRFLMMNNKLYRFLSKFTRCFLKNKIYLPGWSKYREAPVLARKTFFEIWKTMK